MRQLWVVDLADYTRQNFLLTVAVLAFSGVDLLYMVAQVLFWWRNFERPESERRGWQQIREKRR